LISSNFQILCNLSNCSQSYSSFELRVWYIVFVVNDDKQIYEGFASNFAAFNHETEAYAFEVFLS